MNNQINQIKGILALKEEYELLKSQLSNELSSAYKYGDTKIQHLTIGRLQVTQQIIEDLKELVK